MSPAIQIDEDIEGDHLETTDVFFDRIGDSIPIKSDVDSSKFDPQNPPSLPLAVSERFRLLFVAHSSGFCVARTKDLIDAAKDMKEKGKGCCVQELSVVDVPLEKVHILALSNDDSTLAVTLSHSPMVHFFSVNMLLDKNVKPFSYCSVDESSYVKDIQWRKKDEASYLVLSNCGKLYSGALDSPLQVVMENVDAVEWSAKGKFLAVAKGNNLCILSSKFKERQSILLSFRSLVGESDVNGSIKVDSIKWVRRDCIILGCYILTEDNSEENYFVQVIRSEDGKITNASTKPIALSFSDLFGGLIDDIVPFGTGPYLFLSYLKQCKLAFVANRKNTDQHIVLLGWSFGDEKNDVAVIDIDRDKWLPRIELQDNGDDNLVMGLCIDKVSLYEKVEVQIGVEEPKELSSYCVLMCLTLEGKLNMFYVASDSGETDETEVDTNLSDEAEDGEDSSIVVPVESELSEHPPGFGEPKLGPRGFILPSQEASIEKLSSFGREISTKNENSAFTFVDKTSHTDTLSGNWKMEGSSGQQIKLPASQNTIEGQLSWKSSLPDTPVRAVTEVKAQNITNFGSGTGKVLGNLQTNDPSQSNIKDVPKIFDLNKEGTEDSGSNSSLSSSSQPWSVGKITFPNNSKIENATGFGSGNAAFSGKIQDITSLSYQKDQPKSVGWGKEPTGKTGFSGLPTASHQSWSAENSVLNGADARSPFLPSTLPQVKNYENKVVSEMAANASGGFAGRPSAFQDGAATSTSFSSLVNDSVVRSLTLSTNLTQGKTTGNLGVTVEATNVFSGFSRKTSAFKNITASSTSFSLATDVDRSRSPTETVKIEPLPSIRSTQFSSQPNFSSGKLDSQKHIPIKDDYRVPNFSALRNSEPNLSKQSGNIKEMTRELDVLLESIEGAGGFRDACTVLQKSKVEALEQGIGNLSQKCRTWELIMDERLVEVQNLLDKTVQVLARKIYLDGIVKQASDNRYWDLWNCQKLSPELELKCRHIFKLNQELTNQLIELERHFNTLEINKFGEKEGTHMASRTYQSKFGSSSQIQSLHSLHTTMNSQLAAAEQLSECLAKQMAVLSVESPVKKQNVKKELFDTIGIPYDASFSSPATTKIGDTSSVKKLSLSSGSAAAKYQARRNQSSGTHDPETARRRRDSLDRSWVSFEPPKTTVKRIIMQEPQKGVEDKSPLSKKQPNSPHMSNGAAVVRPKDRTTPPSFLYSSESKGIQDTSVKEASENQSTLFKWANDSAGPSISTGLKSFSTFQSDIAFGRSSLPASQLQHVGGQNNTGTVCNDVTVAKSSTGVSFLERSNPVLTTETRSALQSETKTNQKSLSFPVLPSFTPASSKTPNDFRNPSLGSSPTNTKVASTNHATSIKSSTFVSSKSSDPPFSSPSSLPVVSSVSEKFPPSESASKSQPGEKAPVFPALSSAFSAPLFSKINSSSGFPSSVSTSSSLPSFGGSMASSRASVDTPPKIQSMSTSVASDTPVSSSLTSTSPTVSSSSSSASSVTTSTSNIDQSPQTPVSLSASPPVSLAPEYPKIELPTDKLSLKTDTSATMQAPLKLETSAPSAPSVEIPAVLASGNQPSLSNTSAPVSDVTVNSQPNSSAGISLFSAPVAPFSVSVSTTVEKNDPSAVVVTQEDEMEEEAPETSQATDLNLGNLGSFGIGSTPNPGVPKPNPFGGPFGNVAPSPASSPFSLTVPSGELFRPASFNFQSPQPSQQSEPATFNAFSGSFGTGATAQAPTQTGFGQPAQIGQGQQALGSVLGSFGQSRQIGGGLPGAGFGSPGGFGGFGATNSTGGFSSAATGAGFATAGSPSGGFGGFAGVGSGSGFAATATGGGGFGNIGSAGGGFAGAASTGNPFPATGSGGFGQFSGQQGSGFGAGKPAELFTQMRK